MSDLPTFDQLPLQRPGPPYNAWGLYGTDDEVGRVNLISPEAIVRGLQAAKKKGLVINLNQEERAWNLKCAETSLWGADRNRIDNDWGNDDKLTFNTQANSQLDGLRHHPYQNYPHAGDQVYYGGMLPFEARDPNTVRLGIDNYARKPITSRAHLLDIPRYLRMNGLPALSFFGNTTPIAVDVLNACAKAQGVRFEPGDILVVRTGWTDAWAALIPMEQLEIPSKWTAGGCVGVKTDEDMMRWHWDQRLAAVATDCAAYKAWPPSQSPSLHSVFLAGRGMPIIELLDLRELAASCERLQRWTFLFASIALNVPGGIASPVNAQAVH